MFSASSPIKISFAHSGFPSGARGAYASLLATTAQDQNDLPFIPGKASRLLRCASTLVAFESRCRAHAIDFCHVFQPVLDGLKTRIVCRIESGKAPQARPAASAARTFSTLLKPAQLHLFPRGQNSLAAPGSRHQLSALAQEQSLLQFSGHAELNVCARNPLPTTKLSRHLHSESRCPPPLIA